MGPIRASAVRTLRWTFMLVLAAGVPARAQHLHPITFGWSGGHVVVEREVITKLAPGAPPGVRADIESAEDIDATEAIGGGDFVLFHSRSRSTDALVRNLAHRGDVVYVEPNFALWAVNVPNDPHFSSEWGLQNTGQTVNNQTGIPGADISAVPAWDVTTGSQANVVAVLDSGIDYNHQDLAVNVWSAPSAFTVDLGGGPITCPAGSHGFNVLTNACDPLDDNNHGTHCAGIVGAVGNDGFNICGVNWTASLMGIKLLDAGGNGTSANAVNAIEFALQVHQALGIAANVRVLSNSYGGFPFSQALFDEIAKAGQGGMLFVAAAGNAGSDNDATPFYPASYAAPNLIAVAATDAADQPWALSNFGATSVHLGAPGVNIVSTIRNGGYAFFNGTSMAAPHVAGAAALMLAANGALPVDQLRAGILATVDPLPSLAGFTTTGGRLNADGAVHYALAPPDFAVAATPASQSVLQGNGTSYAVDVTGTNGFADTVALAVTGLPGGATATFTPPSVTGPGSSTLAVTTDPVTPAGSYALGITGTTAFLVRSTAVTLVVTAPDFTIDASPASALVARKQATSYTVTVGALNGFAGTVDFTVGGLPKKVTASFSPPSVTGAGSTTLTVQVPAGAAVGTSLLSVLGTSGTLMHAASVSLTVQK